MTSTSLDRPSMAGVRSVRDNDGNEKHRMDETPITYGVGNEIRASSSSSDDFDKPLFDNTHRKLKPRHIQLIGIGGYADCTRWFSWRTDAEHLSCCIAPLEQRFTCR